MIPSFRKNDYKMRVVAIMLLAFLVACAQNPEGIIERYFKAIQMGNVETVKALQCMPEEPSRKSPSEPPLHLQSWQIKRWDDQKYLDTEIHYTNLFVDRTFNASDNSETLNIRSANFQVWKTPQEFALARDMANKPLGRSDKIDPKTLGNNAPCVYAVIKPG